MSKHLFIFSIIFLSLTALTSCDECRGLLGNQKITCSNGGTCNDGACDCLKGFFGDDCTDVDSCELLDVVCVRGYCETGQCFCDPGFSGDDCSIESRKKFLGTYNVTEYCQDLDTTWGYNIVIERNVLDGSVMNIANLFSYDNFPINGYFSKVEGTATPDSESFSINNQKPDDGEKSISGQGVLTVVDSVATINISYVTTNGNKEFTCTCEGTRIATE